MGRRDELKVIRKQIDTRYYRALARSLPWPYSGMVNDLLYSIREGGNYLSALGLSVYTEVCGRQILNNGDNSVQDWKCYNEFLTYMGAGKVLNRVVYFNGKKIFFKDAVRNGLVHRYFMKIDSGGIAMLSNNSQTKKYGFEFKKIKGKNYVFMVVVPYFKLFCEALRKAKEENKLRWS